MEGSLVAYKVFSNGSVLNASEINDNLMNQSVMVFSNSTTRAAALTAPVEGMLTWLEDVNRYESYNGTAWVQLINPNAWTSYTPTTSNLTLGNGTITAKYNVVGKTIFLAIRFVLGSTSAITGSPTFTLPSGFTSAALSTFSPVGNGLATISSTSYIMTTVAISSNRVAAVVNNASGTYASGTDMSSTIPATWANGSIYEINAKVEIA
jgi:hypothetical protein